MDLENFDEQDAPKSVPKPNPRLELQDLVQIVDDCWYRSASRRGRWMDLIGDYAGREPFVIDGNELILLLA